MPAVGVTQAARFVVVIGEKERRIRIVSRVFIEEAVYGAEEKFWIRQRKSALAAQIGLQVGHQQSSSDPFAGDVANHQTQPAFSYVQKIEVVSANLMRLQAQTGIFERFYFGMYLRKQTSLYLSGDLNFLAGPLFGLIFLS